MAKARIDVECSNCGKEIRIDKYFNKREDADKWQANAVKEGHLCKDCYREKQNEIENIRTSEILSKLNTKLPELSGSEKQIKYASDLRNGFIAENEDTIKRYFVLVEKFKTLDDETMKRNMAKGNLSTPEELFTATMRQLKKGLPETHAIFTETNSGKVIDKLS